VSAINLDQSAPAGATPGPSGRRFDPGRVISSLRHPNYRKFFFGQLVSMMGTWMEAVAQSFLVLQLTHNGTDLGFALAARFTPVLLFGPMGGLFADRRNKRRILYITQTLAGSVSAAFAVLTATHLIHMWLVYVLAASLGMVNVFDNPARQSFISEMVPREALQNAVALNSVALNLARVFGAMVGGLLVDAVGVALCFAFNAASFGAVLVSLFAMNSALLYPAQPVKRLPGQVKEGLRYVRDTPLLLVPLIMILVIGALAWEFNVTLPLMASKAFGGGAGTYGLMVSVMAAGAVLGGVVSAARSKLRARSLCLAAIYWGTAITVAALAPNLPLELVALFFVGIGSITFNSYAKTTLQLAAEPAMRGRVMSLWFLAWQGSTPIGGPLVGWVAQEEGARWSLLVGGVPTIVCGLLALPVLLGIDRLAAARAAAEISLAELN
jgi:MFS family permease